MMRILVADDKRINRRILSSMLVDMGYEPIEVENGQQALAVLTQPHAPQIALLDWEMPLLSGLETCRQLRANQQDTLDYTFIILATGHTAKEDMADGYEAGVDDYLLKPFERHTLYMRLNVAKRIVNLQNHLIRLATRDGLTGILNRSTVIGKLQEYMNRQERYPLAICVLDIDFFKKVNDTFGHQVGDEVLIETTRRIGDCIPKKAWFGRLGGEEFIVIFPQTDYETAVILCEQVRSSVDEAPISVGDEHLKVTVSIGFTAATEFVKLDDFLRVADTNMYLAKNSGRNRVYGSFMSVTL